MKHSALSKFASLLLLTAAVAHGADPLPPVIERYEQLLLRSPGKGTAFDKVYQHFFEGEGLEKLAARWKEKADGKTPESGVYKLLLGTLAERQGQTPEALRYYQKAAELRPADARVWMALGDAQVGAGRFAEAITALQKALTSNPTRDLRPALFRQLARSQQRAFDPEGALKTWQQFIAESPDDPFVIEEAADAMAESERYAEAQAQYEKLRDLAGTDPYKRVTAIMKLAQLEEKQGRREQGRALYESALPLAAETSWIQRELRARIEESYRRQDDVPGLVAYYEAWLQKRERDVEAALRLSDALLELNRKKDAVAWLRQAGAWAPDRKEVQVALAKRLGEIGQGQEAVTLLEKLTQAHPEEESYREFLGDAHWQVFLATKDDAAKRAAVESWQQLAPATTKDGNKVSRVADLLRAKELPEEALAGYARAVGLAPEVPELRQRWAEYLFELKRPDEAWKVLREMVAGDRATAPNFLRLARLQQRQHELEGALDSARQGLALEPQNFELLSLQWRLFSESGKWEEAAALYEPLLAAAPSLYSTEQVEDGQLQALRALERLEATGNKLSARLGQQPPLTEAELRLLVRILLQGDDLPAVGAALAEGRTRFPDSVPLARREVDYQKRKGNIPGRVAALERLLQLQPKQKIEWLREIARVYQEEAQWDKALAAAQRVLEEAPASADSYLLAADLNFAAQRFEPGVARLKEAIKFSDRPNDLRLRLARAYQEAGRTDEARQTFDAVFEAETDPKARLALTRQLAEVYLQQGKLDELTTRFRQRQRAEEGGWRYALYLAEIFQQMQDFAAAREELSKALGARSRDGNFLRQLMQLAQAEGNPAERARYAKLLAEVEPSDAHQIDLADALVDAGDLDGALAVLKTNRDTVLKDPLAWREVLNGLRLAGAGPQVADLLQAVLAQRTDDWRGRLTLAEIQIGLRNFDAAEQVLWEIFALPVESPGAKPPPPAAVGSPVLGGRFNPYAMYGRLSGTSPFQQRVYGSYALRETIAQLFAPVARRTRSSGRYGSRFSSYSYGSGKPAPPAGVNEARDSAVLYLSVLAQQQGREAGFLHDLDAKMKGAPRAERITVFSLIQARDALLHEIEGEVAQPSGNRELEEYCFQVLLGALQTGERDEAQVERVYTEIESLFQRLRDPAQRLQAAIGYHSALLQNGRTERANQIADEVLAAGEKAEVTQIPILFGFALQREALPLAEKLLDRLLAAANDPAQSVLKQQISSYKVTLADALLKKEETRPRGVKLIAESLKDNFPATAMFVVRYSGMSAWSGLSRGRSTRRPWRDGQQQFPFPNRYMDETQIQRWQQIHGQLKAADAMPLMTAELNHQIQNLPEDQAVYTQLARACFRWWDGEKGAAVGDVRQLAREMKDDDLHLTVATMLAELNQPQDAIRELESVTATSGDAALNRDILLLNLARSTNDLPKAKELALTLSERKLDQGDLGQLTSVLSELGLQERAAALSRKYMSSARAAQGNRLEDRLGEMVRTKNSKEALALARTILSRDPLAPMRQGNEDYARRQALDALSTFGQLADYTADLERQLAETPSSARTLLLLAEAQGHKDRSKSVPYYRKLVELKPDDTDLQLRLAELLKEGKEVEEAMRIWEAALVKDPDTVLQSAFSSMLSSYQAAKQLGRLSDLLLKNKPRNVVPGPPVFVGIPRAFTQPCSQLAQLLQQQGQLKEAVELWRAALTDSRKTPGNGEELNVLKALIPALVELGEAGAAAAELEQFFFPPAKPRPLLGWTGNERQSYWMQQISINGSGRLEIPATTLLRSLAAGSALDALRAKALAAASERPNDPGSMLVVFIDVARRNPAALPEIRRRLLGTLEGAAKQRDYSRTQLAFAVAQDLRDWPEGRRLALELMQAADKASPVDRNDSFTNMLRPQLAELASELGETEVARRAYKAWLADFQRTTARSQYGPEIEQHMKILEGLAKVGLFEEARAQVELLKKGPQMRGDSTARRTLDEFEKLLALLSGDLKSPSLLAWVVPPVGATAPHVICWEFGAELPRKPETGRTRPLTATGLDLPSLDGRFTIDLFQGASETSMRKVATLEKAKSRGTWKSEAPLGPGYVMAVARDGDTRLFSTPTFIPSSPNVLENPEFEARAKPGGGPAIAGWSGVRPADVTSRATGPEPGGRAFALKIQRSFGNEKVMAEGILLEPGKNYFISGWSRTPRNQGSFDLGGHFLDKNGAPGNSISGRTSGDSNRWTYFSKWLVRTRENGDSRSIIPPTAVAFRPELDFGDGCELAGLYIGAFDP